jgi:hypothetical protein
MKAGVRIERSLAMAVVTLAVAAPCQQPEMPQPPVVVAGDNEGQRQLTATVERHGFTGSLAEPREVGTFANGDPWGVGPVQIVGIEPHSETVAGRTMHGSMIDPDPTSGPQGYDSAMFGDDGGGRWSAELNVARDVSAQKPLALAPGRSLVSTQGRLDGGIPTLQTAAVLTCVEEAPAPDAFRPPYVRGDKSIRHRAADLQFSLLRRVAPAGDAPSAADVARRFERVWLDHVPGWPGRYAFPADNMPNYGRDIAAAVGDAALVLNLDLPDVDKRDLLVRFVQYGIDLFGCLEAGCRWQADGGHGSGRKFPILFAGYVLGDQRMLNVGQRFDGGPDGAFGEDMQTFTVRETSPGKWNGGQGGYTREHDGLPEWGFSHATNPQNDDAEWGGNPYRLCCTANAWVGEALAARLLGLQDAWNHPAFFAYMDRYMQAQFTEAWHRAWSPWQAAMWDAHRKDN